MLSGPGNAVAIKDSGIQGPADGRIAATAPKHAADVRPRKAHYTGNLREMSAMSGGPFAPLPHGKFGVFGLVLPMPCCHNE